MKKDNKRIVESTFVSIDYNEKYQESYKAVVLDITYTKGRDRKIIFNYGNPIIDWLDCMVMICKLTESQTPPIRTMLSSSCDHFSADGDTYKLYKMEDGNYYLTFQSKISYPLTNKLHIAINTTNNSGYTEERRFLTMSPSLHMLGYYYRCVKKYKVKFIYNTGQITDSTNTLQSVCDICASTLPILKSIKVTDYKNNVIINKKITKKDIASFPRNLFLEVL